MHRIGYVGQHHVVARDGEGTQCLVVHLNASPRRQAAILQSPFVGQDDSKKSVLQNRVDDFRTWMSCRSGRPTNT
jgi:hypothetical protein